MYRAQEDHIIAKIGGFLLAPTAVAVTTGALTSTVTGKTIDPTTGALIMGGTAVLLYMASERLDDETLQAFARGGMWGAIVGLAAVPFVK